MRVEGTSTVAAQTVRRKSTDSRSGFKVETAGHSERTERVAEAQPLATLDTLVTLQEVPDGMAGRKRAIKRASDMLDMLDGIRLDLLNGEVPEGRLGALLRLVRLQRDQIDDPRLSHVLDEIELRARVELAKLGQAC
jgi:Class II flagellar assembly regulator